MESPKHDSETQLVVNVTRDIHGNVAWEATFDFPNGNTAAKDRVRLTASGKARWVHEAHVQAVALLEDMRGAWAYKTLPEDQFEIYPAE